MKEQLKQINVSGFIYCDSITPEKETVIRNRLKVPADEPLLGFFTLSDDDTINDGLAITDKSLYWRAFHKVNGTAKMSDNGSMELANMPKYTLSFDKEMTGHKATFTKQSQSFKGPDTVSVTIKDEYLDSFTQLKEAVNEVFRENYSSEEQKKDVYNIKKFKAYINDDADTFSWYKRAFDKYNYNGVERMGFNWSWAGFYCGPIYLFHRKSYVASIVAFISIMICLPLLGTILGMDLEYGEQYEIIILGVVTVWPLMAILSPFILYKRYRKVESQIEATGKTEEQKLEMYKVLGGTNVITGLLGGIAFLVFVVMMIKSCF